MNRWGVSDQVPKALIRKIGAKVKGTKVRTMVTTIVRVIMSEKETTIATTTLIGVTMVYRNDRNGPYVPPQNREVTPRDGGGSMSRLRICCIK